MVSQQGGMFDLEIEDAEFEQAIEDWLSDKENRAESARIVRARKEGFERHISRLEPGQRVRVGAYCFEVSANERDEYTVESSSSKGMRQVAKVDEA